MKTTDLIKWLLSFVRPMTGKVFLAAFLGIISNLSVIAIPILGLNELFALVSGAPTQPKQTFIFMLICGVIRGVARYLEQYLNHEIAFRLLAIIRDRIFETLRAIGPAKLSGHKSGDLVTAITSDVEALEVFFAHTISPILIAFGTTIATIAFLASHQPILACILFVGQLIVGILIPVVGYQKSQQLGDDYQQSFVDLNQQVMENVASLQEITYYSLEEERLASLDEAGDNLNQQYRRRLTQESWLRISSELILLITAVALFLVGATLQMEAKDVLIGTILSLSSFGSVLALSGLGSALLTTFASGRRLYALTKEQPIVSFAESTEELPTIDAIDFQQIDFSYTDTQELLKNISLSINKGDKIGIGGESGNGKSTLLKLLMRYWDPDKGRINLNQTPLPKITEDSLHQTQGVMEQSTFIFEDTLAANIRLGNPQASQDELEQAAKKAAIHDWISTLPEGYQTIIGGNARNVSDGERQRIGMARLFLHDAPLLLLDEPTSNLDYLNEQAILASLKNGFDQKTVLMISHRETTLAIADQIYQLENGTLTQN
ncbi:ABC transporter ATP-binding protein [Enterococcus sp. JM4C]|uniref:amino acid ABC transporter ATP-binding/permease protein n=1 Tax=Candidatus Enterococcus huntleyi TaxID=1857217 RepID=UPI00137AA3A0|nr:ABC transporter ATP-binding protein [Enterococcus sp. JM4C]KAF1297322.1 ABC transporter ATP-binding protein [Enterococcus sp. JM4C]